MKPRWPWVLAAVFALVQAGLLVNAAWSLSDTYDENVYVRAGALQVAYRDMSMVPVPTWGFGLALVLGGELGDIRPRLEQSSEAYLFDGSSPAARLRVARLATIVVSLLGGLALWRAASRAGPFPALLAHALWCFSPLTLAHGALATLDVWVAAFLAVMLLCGTKFAESGTARWAALAGAAGALACGAKITALGALPLFALVALQRKQPRAILWFALAFLVTIWAACAFQVGTLDYGRPGFGVQLGPLPFPSWLRQIVAQSDHGFVVGHAGFFEGEVSKRGHAGFYLWSLALQVPLAAWGLFLLALWFVPRRWRRGEWKSDLLLLAYPILLFVVMSLARTQLGLRYLLPAVPFVLLWLARVLAEAPALPCSVLITATAATAIAAQPHQLAYFNPLAGNQWQALHHLVEGVDWCQGKQELARWLRHRRARNVHYTGCGTQPEAWGIRATPIRCDGQRPPGLWVLHAGDAFGTLPAAPGCLEWLLARPPDAIIAQTIFVYEVL